MQTCQYCSVVIDSDSLFCDSCGKQIVQTFDCPQCNGKIETSAKFCKYCAFEFSNHLQLNNSSIRSDANKDNPASLISPSGAAFAVICFFLPWVQQSCGEKTITSTGADLGGIYWFVPFMGIVAFAAYFICKYQKDIFRARPFIIGSAVIALCFFIYISYAFSGSKDAVQFKAGFFGSIIGFILAIVGCIFMSRPVVTVGQNDSNDTYEII